MNISGLLRISWVTLVVTVLSFGSSEPARAGYIASNLGSGGSFTTTGGYTLSGPNVAAGIGYSLAVEFQVSGSSTVGFGDAELALQYHSGVNSLQILLMTSAGGLPGVALSTMSVSNLSSAASLVTVATSTAVTLSAGTNYWLVAIASTNSSFSWLTNNQGSVGHDAFNVNHGSGPTGWTTSATDTDLAFQIDPAAVPTPRSGVLFGVGLAGISALSFKKRRRASSESPEPLYEETLLGRSLN
jgi:hypothetical protein